MTRRPQLLKGYSLQKIVRSWTVCTNVFCVLAAQPAAHHSGGILINLLVQLACYKPIVSWRIAVIWRLKNACPNWMTPSVYSAAMVSKTVLRYVRKALTQLEQSVISATCYYRALPKVALFCICGC